MTTTNNTDASKDFGARLRQAMSLRDYSARSLAAALKERGGSAVTRTTIGYYLAGTYSPTVVQLLDIAATLRVRAEWLLSGEGEMFRPHLGMPIAKTMWPWAGKSLQPRLESATMLLQALREDREVPESLSTRDLDADPSSKGHAVAAARVELYLEAAVKYALSANGYSVSGHRLEGLARAFQREAPRGFENAILLLLMALENLSISGAPFPIEAPPTKG